MWRPMILIAAPLDLQLVPGHVTPAWGPGGQAPDA